MQAVLLKASGLYTFPNSLSEIPPGSLQVADNVVIDRNGIIEQRRGFQQYGNTFGSGTDRVKQLLTYKDRILRHYDSTLQYDSNGTGNFLSFSGNYNETEAGLRIKYIEANGNLYFTTSDGIKVISALSSSQFTTAANYIRQAGAAQALDVSGVVDYSVGGWFIYQTDQPGQTKVAYRVTWGFNDANGNFVEGAPSSRLVLTNFSETDSANVDLTFQIPPQITTLDTQYFYRIYRTGIVQTSIGVTLVDLDPGDEMNLVIQDFPTAGQLSARTVTVTDNVPEAFRRNGALLYTNPVSGDGILQSNYPPPIAKDINLFQSTVFYANTQTIQQLNISLLSVADLISGTSTITIDGQRYTFVGTPEIQSITFDTQAATTDGGYFLINSASNTRKYFVWYSKSGAPEIQNLTFDTGANTNDGGYFLINSADDVNKYVIWFDKTGSTLPPTGADTFGRTLVRVPITAGMTDVQVATAVANAGVSSTDFTTSISVATVQVTNTSNGVTTLAADGLAVPVGGVFSVALVQAGVDPTPQPSAADTVGRLPIFVDISTAVTADDVALATATAVSLNVDFDATSLGAVATITNTDNGSCDPAVDSVITPVPIVGPVTQDQVGTGEDAANLFVLLGGSLSPSQNIDETARSLVKIINSNPLGSVDAFYQSGPTDLPGLILLQSRNLADSPFYVTANNVAVAIAGALVSGGDTINIPNHSFIDDDQVIYSSDGTDIGGLTSGDTYFIINSSTNDFQLSLTMGGSAIPLTSQGSGTITFIDITNTDTGNEFSPAIPTTGTTLVSANQVQLNALYYSKFQQPEAVPIVNNFLVGPKDKAILRILPLRTGLMIIKEDGIYRLTGVNGQFQIDPFDNSAICLAPDSAVVLNNQIYMFSTQGVVTLTDTGVSVISRPIEDKLQKISTPSYNFKPNTFGVSYESDRAYLLWTVTSTNDEQPTQCFRYNTFTNAWTRWPIVKTAGVVLFSSQVLYLAPGDENFIEVERKNIDRTDYADRIYPLQIPANSIVNATEIELSSTSNVEVGDVLVQTQYLTIDQFNQLLRMLDSDPGTSDKDYLSTLIAFPGSDLGSDLIDLANKLDSDSGLNETDFFSSMGPMVTFADFQSNFNILTSLLNANVNAKFTNYVTSVDTIALETIVTGLVENSSNVTVQYLLPIIQGGILSYRGIQSEVVWAPQTFGDPSISKHVSEGTFMFDNTSFFSASVSYASDLMPSFEEVSFPELGIGDWGYFIWDAQSWGGLGTSVPLRTYIPRNKQYCRFLLPRFKHFNAREKFALLGGSLTFRPLTERAYRS